MENYSNIILAVHILIAMALVVVVLLQRSEGGALGIGGGGGGLMSARGAGNALTRATTVLAIAFFTTSVALTILARQTGTQALDLEGELQGTVDPAAPAGETPDLPDLPGLPSLPGLEPEAAAPTQGDASDGAAADTAPDAAGEAPAESAPEAGETPAPPDQGQTQSP